ncbi:MAG: hypothetical protein ABL962_01005, partial [Fimbriimonadaceae bacterium]
INKLPGDYITDLTAQQKAIAELKRLNVLTDPANFDPNLWRQREAATNAAPLRRFLYKAIKRLGASQLLGKNAWGRLVFTLNPNRLQKKLPITVAEIEALSKTQAAFVDALGEFEDHGFYQSPTTKLKAPIANIILSVKQSSLVESGSLTCTMKAISATGQVLATVGHNISNSPFSQGPPPVIPAGTDKVITLDALSKELLENIKKMQGNNAPSASSAELTKFQVKPDQNELTGLVTTECLAAVADSTHKNVILAMDDIAFFMVAFQSVDGKPTVRRFDSSMSQTQRIREEESGWVRYKSGDPAQDRETRVNRTFLAEHFKRVESGASKLESFAQLALQHPGRLEDTSYPLFFMLQGQEPPGSFGRSLNPIRFFGLMSKDQKQAALAGPIKLIVRDLTRDQYQIVEAIAYGEGNDLNQYSYAPQEVGSEEPYQQQSFEPTDLYLNGLTDPFYIQISAVDKPSLFGIQRYGSRPADENSIAWEMLQLERQDLFPYAGSLEIQNAKYVQGYQRTWDMTFHISPNGSLNQQLTDHTINPGEGKAYKDLPEDLRKRVQERLVALRKDYQNMKPGDFGNGVRKSPPPR